MATTTATPSYREALTELRGNLAGMLPADALGVFDADAEQLAETYAAPLRVKAGDKAPTFTLSDATGEPVRLADVLAEGPVVLTFYRGTWCPYCNLYLSQLQATIAESKAAGAQLIAISPQTPDESLTLRDKLSLEYHVLSDIGNQVARQYTTVFRNGDAPVATMTDLGFDFDGHYADDSRELPVPATFVIAQDGVVAFAKTEGGDYRERVELGEVLEALRGL